MHLKNPLNPKVFQQLINRWQVNQLGGLKCLLMRRQIWLWQLLQKLNYHIQVTVPLFYDENMTVVTGETVSKNILVFGYTEVPLTALMINVLETGQTFVDVGTHFGYEALLATRLVGKDGHVICFEPNPSAFAIAKKNLAHLPQSRIYQLGIAEQSKSLRLQNRPIWESAFNSLSSNNADSEKSNTYEHIEVSVTSLDEILRDRVKPIDFLKCDVEGFELNVLQGAHRILSEDQPILVLEADMPSTQGQVSSRAMELADYLRDYDYSAFNFDFDDKLILGQLNSFPTHHPNIVFFPNSKLSYLFTDI